MFKIFYSFHKNYRSFSNTQKLLEDKLPKVLQNKLISHEHSDHDNIPQIGDPDADNIEKWKNHPNIKVNPDNTMEVKDYLDPLYKKLPSYRTDVPMSLQGRLIHERERLTKMNDSEREWRLKWLKAQELKSEPVEVPELHLFYNNIFRRLWHMPMDYFFSIFKPIIGKTATEVYRYFIPKIIFFYIYIILLFYYFGFRQQTWECCSKPYVLLAQYPEYCVDEKDIVENKVPPPDYAFSDFGFSQRSVFKDIRLDRSNY